MIFFYVIILMFINSSAYIQIYALEICSKPLPCIFIFPGGAYLFKLFPFSHKHILFKFYMSKDYSLYI